MLESCVRLVRREFCCPVLSNLIYNVMLSGQKECWLVCTLQVTQGGLCPVTQQTTTSQRPVGTELWDSGTLPDLLLFTSCQVNISLQRDVERTTYSLLVTWLAFRKDSTRISFTIASLYLTHSIHLSTNLELSLFSGDWSLSSRNRAASKSRMSKQVLIGYSSNLRSLFPLR